MIKSRLTVEENEARVDAFVARNCDLTRERVKQLLQEGMILLNGRVVKPNTKISVGDEVTIEMPAPKPFHVEGQEMDLDIVYEDKDVIVINKANDVVVHPAPGHLEKTLVNGLVAHCGDLSGINGIERPGVVHRIDKDTTGLLMFAKNDNAHQSLAKQLEEKTVTRRYMAIVEGIIQHESGTIDAPIGRDTKNRKKMAITDSNSKHAITHFVVKERLKKHTLIEVQLETGRTHQIRVHMAYIGHPVLGDSVYGKRKSNDGYGQYLHAMTLGFIHPTTGEYMEFTREPEKHFLDKIEELRG